MDSTNLCNALRMEFEGIFENKIPLDAFPAKQTGYLAENRWHVI